MCFFFTYCFANEQSKHQFIDTCSSQDVGSDIKEIDESVQYIYQHWNWPVAKDLVYKNSLLIQYDVYWLIYNQANLSQQELLAQFKSNEDHSLFCINSSNQIPYLLIKKKTKPIKNKKIQFFNFLYHKDKQGFEDYANISKFFGKTLLINLESVNPNILEELELTITHEALHLFGQDKIQFSEPVINKKKNEIQTINLDQTAINIDGKCNIDQKILEEFDGREYLEYKNKCSLDFKKSVSHEICLDRNLMIFIMQTRNDRKNDNKLHVLLSLKEIIYEMEKRLSIDENEIFSLEWYWYLMEGVPQYMEQIILMEKNPNRLVSQYNAYCEELSGHEEYFYPLLAGSAIWHGLDYIHDTKEEWADLAMQYDYNVPSKVDSKFWFYHLHQLLNDKIKQLNLN